MNLRDGGNGLPLSIPTNLKLIVMANLVMKMVNKWDPWRKNEEMNVVV